ncbi:MAG: hypothetical protein ACE5FN_02355 [Leptospirillia bacterium]
MARRAVKVELEEVALNTRFRKFSGDRNSKVRQRAKVEVVRVSEDEFGVTIKRGITTVKKGKFNGKGLKEASIRSAVQRDIRAGKYDDALFDGYDRIQAAKKKKKAK